LEEYPVFLPSDTEHWVIWINPDIQDSNQAQTIVDQALENIHLQFEITSDDYIIWHRRGRNGTAPMAIHYHIYVRSGFLKEI
jgi:predicted Rdx family selenoprotein